MTPIENRLSAQLKTPWLRRTGRWLAWLLTAAYFGFALLVLVLRYAVLPRIQDYREEVERALSAALQRPVAIARIEAGWQGLRPRLGLFGLNVRDQAGQPALRLDHVEAVVGWTSLLYLRPHFARLEVEAPDLAVRRDRAGLLYVAGLLVDPRASETGIGDWLLEQDEIVVTGARLTWSDELRAAAPLSLTQLDFRLVNGLRRHRFGLAFDPPPALASRVDLRGDLRGSDLKDLKSWYGEIYGQLGYADLAVWRQWVDYPLELPQGRGGLRVWLDFAQLRPTALTVDLALADTHLRLADGLPMLELKQIAGRVRGQTLEGGFAASASHLSLATQDGLRLPPVDMSLRWQKQAGEFEASDLDLKTLDRLAAYLPLPTQVREPLVAYAPGGHLRDFKLGWEGKTQPFEKYRINGRFADLHLRASGAVPGLSGFSGKIDGDERSGSIELVGKDALLDLPAIFPEPRIALSGLQAKAGWKRSGEAVLIKLNAADFHNPDAVGKASGSYRWRAGTPGEIDLDVRLTHAQGGAVWRYMPYAVGQNTRDWLRSAIVGGVSEETTLRLKGDLARFPFADGSGTFLVKGTFHGPSLHYAEGWPQIDDIDGSLEFNGARMTISASSGKILGATIGPVQARIDDLLVMTEILTVEGKAAGATSEFLKFIEASPVGERIDHFTANMAAGGPGELNIKLNMPLRQIDDTQVTGGYRFDGNRLVFEAGLPPLEDVQGRLEFTADQLTARGIEARMLGGPLKLDVKTQDGAALVTVNGEASMAQLRQKFPHPVFEHLSGATRWSATVRVKKKAEVRVTSSLRGIASSLPDPFNKTAASAMPLLFERKPADPKLFAARRARDAAGRDQIEMSLGKALRIQLLRRQDGGAAQTERGLIALGDIAPRLPERGVLVAVNLPRIDTDFWRSLASRANGKPEQDKGEGLGISQIDLRGSEVIALGRVFHDFHLTGSKPAAIWNLDLKSREISAKLDWQEGAEGRISGRISQFTLPEAAPGAGTGDVGEALRELPDIDLVFDRFALHGMEFGEVRIAAENQGGYWNATLGAQNDDASFTGQCKWRPGSDAPDTQLDFKLKAKSIEKTLARIGYANAVRRGNAALEGSLSWDGAPYDIDYATLNGSLKLDARDGQFNKLDPTVVGRLLGIISLQSLPRRITLDFRDVFSQGFAFDVISANAGVKSGVIETTDMVIKGPAAKVQMAGSVDLVRETQDLKVRVQPALGESAATAALFISPAVGATAWVLNKVFGNPVDAAFAYDYAVSGSWADPKVEKLAAQPAAKKEGGK